MMVIYFYTLFFSLAYAENSSEPNSSPAAKESAEAKALDQYEKAPVIVNKTQVDNAKSNAKKWEVSQAFKYGSGKFGTTQTSTTYEENTTLTRNFSKGDLSLTLPYLWQRGTTEVTSVSRRVVNKRVVRRRTATQTKTSTDGIGDLTLDGNYYLLNEDQNTPIDITLTSYTKAPTASSKDGLGSGEWDGGLGIGFTKKLIYNFKAIADFSYYFIGKVSGQETRNQINFDSGLEYDFTEKTSGTVSYEYGSSTTKGEAESKDIALALAYKINDTWKLNFKGTAGLTEGSPAESFQLGATIGF